MNYAEVIIDGYNAVTGAIVAVLSYILGEHWFLFVAFLGLNVADWITGWMKSRINKKENSMAGWKGILKKLGYWLMIMVAFGSSAVFVEIGNAIGIDLGITTLLGWFVLASLLVNEIRSICENFVEAGYNVPTILIKGLEVAEKVVNQDLEKEEEERRKEELEKRNASQPNPGLLNKGIRWCLRLLNKFLRFEKISSIEKSIYEKGLKNVIIMR